MNEIRNHIQGNFTIIPNGLIEDIILSDRSRFLYIVLAQKPHNWVFYTKQLCKTLGMHVDTFRKYRNELSQRGWITVEEQKISNGKFNSRIYHLNSSPKDVDSSTNENQSYQQKARNFPSRKNTVTEKNSDGKNPTLNNTNLKQRNTFNKNKNEFLERTKNSTIQNPNPRQ
ncbi:MAG: helix-turn-helix domain-containing protein [Aequorivita sp.]